MIKFYYDTLLGLARWVIKPPYDNRISKKRRKRKHK